MPRIEISMRSIRIRGTERESEGGASGPMDSEYGLMFHGLDVELSVDSDHPMDPQSHGRGVVKTSPLVSDSH